MANTNTDRLRERACKAFTPEFRAALADACQTYSGTLPIGVHPRCVCPEGVLIGEHRPRPYCVTLTYPLTHHRQHFSFQAAFDRGQDDGTPEAALGLLYRVRYGGTVEA